MIDDATILGNKETARKARLTHVVINSLFQAHSNASLSSESTLPDVVGFVQNEFVTYFGGLVCVGT